MLHCVGFAAIIISCTEAVLFDCHYYMNSFTSVGSVYTCDARVIVFNPNDSNVYGVTPNHLYNSSNDDVQGLLITNQRLPAFPKRLERFFPNLKAIYMHNDSLTHVTGDDLRPFPHLTHLTLWKNQIQVLESDLFKYVPHLRLIDFDNNLIIHAGPNVLDSLVNLNYAYFSSNICISRSVTSATLSDLASLKYDLVLKCPPTLDMFFSELLSRKSFAEKVNEIVANQTASIVERVDVLEAKVANITN